jgi:hypothetical protein
MDYAMLSRLQIQSTDQENYLKLPAILVGASAAVLPEQLAIWSYPLQNADADQASFNMVTAMLCRIHQSGRLDLLSMEAGKQVMPYRNERRLGDHALRLRGLPRNRWSCTPKPSNLATTQEPTEHIRLADTYDTSTAFSSPDYGLIHPHHQGFEFVTDPGPHIIRAR